MPKQKIEIEVDIPDGYEATGEFRWPGKEEFWLTENDDFLYGEDNTDRIILRKTYVPPSWIKPGMEIYYEDAHWMVRHPNLKTPMYINPEIVDFDHPPYSPYQVPERKETT